MNQQRERVEPGPLDVTWEEHLDVCPRRWFELTSDGRLLVQLRHFGKPKAPPREVDGKPELCAMRGATAAEAVALRVLSEIFRGFHPEPAVCDRLAIVWTDRFVVEVLRGVLKGRPAWCVSEAWLHQWVIDEIAEGLSR